MIFRRALTLLIAVTLTLATILAPSSAWATGGGHWSSWAHHTWIPRDEPGIVMWVRADAGITISTGVSTWADLSGNGRNLTQGTAGKQPAFSATGGPGSMPCVTGDGVDDRLSTSSFTTAQPVQVFLVAKYNTVFAAQTTIMDGVSGDTMRLFRTAAGQLGMKASTQVVASGFTETAWHYHSLRFNGASSTGAQDTVVKISGNAGAVSSSGMTLFEYGGTTQNANASVAEAVVYNLLLSATEESRISFYFKSRYGL